MSMERSRTVPALLICSLGLCLSFAGPIGCGPSSSQIVDREAPQFKEAMKRSAKAYIDREAELKKARGKQRR
jgi:hypothetical protein